MTDNAEYERIPPDVSAWATTCVCGHDRERHWDAAIAPECLDCDCTVYSSESGAAR